MKNLFAVLFIVLLFVNCSNDASANIIGKWKLSQVLYDIGDGKGTFKDVTSTNTIEFFDDNTFKANFSFCNSEEKTSTGTYAVKEGKIYPKNCEDRPIIQTNGLSFRIEKSALIVNLFCTEPCASKYIKIE